MDNSVAVRTYAKINLTLDIVGKRTDGYHFMKTIMQSVSIYDEVSVDLRDDKEIVISCDAEGVPCDDTNIAVKAVKAFFEYAQIEPVGIEISIKKNIPMEAGLAGGSSNAAGVLTALNQIFETEFSTQQLCEIGVKLGADVPFCLIGGTVLAEGIGELLMPLPDLAECYFVIAKGAEGVSTAEAFARYDSLIVTEHPDCDEMVPAIAVGNVERISELCMNVLERAANLPDIEKIKDVMLENDALCAIMTGSGSAVYGIFEKKKHASGCADELKDLVDFVEVCTPVENGIEII